MITPQQVQTAKEKYSKIRDKHNGGDWENLFFDWCQLREAYRVQNKFNYEWEMLKRNAAINKEIIKIIDA